MSTKEMDAILSRIFLDGKFRQQIREDPERALADYSLSPIHKARLLRLKRPAQKSASAAPTIHKNTFSSN
jgi:hypothetical protein